MTFLVVGTRGDAQPVVALGRALRERGCTVVVATSHDHRALVEAHGLVWSDLSPSYADEIDRAEERLGGSQTDGARLLRERLTAASVGWAAQARAAAAGADILLGAGTLMGTLAAATAAGLGIPCVHIHVMPLIPTRAFPPPVPPPTRQRPGAVNLALFRLVRFLVWRACFAGPIATARRDLSLPPSPGPDRRAPPPRSAAGAPLSSPSLPTGPAPASGSPAPGCSPTRATPTPSSAASSKAATHRSSSASAPCGWPLPPAPA